MYGWYQYLAVTHHRRHRCAAVWHQKLGSIGSDLGASIKGFKKAMSDDDKHEKPTEDADFTAKSIAEKQDEVKKEDAKRHDKEQV